jgi:hypothetical protein
LGHSLDSNNAAFVAMADGLYALAGLENIALF